MFIQALTFLSCAFMVRSAHKDRHQQISRMKNYELLHLEPVVVDQDTMTLEFDALNQHYRVHLDRKPLSAPSFVIHSNVDSKDHFPLSSNTESCHFSGRVMNTDKSSVVSASICPGRGIRARITAFGETLIIKPSAYYLDTAKDALANHTVADEVLMYRLSDFERGTIMESDPVTFTDDVEQLMESKTAENDDRRRLYSSYSSWSPAETELAVVIGPVRVANYKYDYGDNWYSQLFQDTADMVNAVDDIYAATNWNANGRNSVGGLNSLRVVFSEIHLVHEFTGDYYSLRPPKRTPDDCDAGDDYDDSDYCSVYGSRWLSDIRSWVGNHFDTSNYDNVQFITDIKFNWEGCPWYAGLWNVCSRTLGWGGIGTICKGSSSVGVDSYAEDFGGNDNLIGTVAHELGHNFGLYHDGQSGPASSCGASDGLMGYGDERSTFSTCSLDGMEDYFNGWGYGMSCLGTGWDNNFVSNVDGNGQANVQSTCPGLDCIYVTGFTDDLKYHEGYYSPSGSCHDDHKYYIGPNDEYLCYDYDYSRWTFSWSLCTNPWAMSSSTGGDATSPSYWMEQSSTGSAFYSSDSLYVSSCSGNNQAFNEDSTCLDDSPLGEDICISTQSNLWDDDRTFTVFDELCLNDKPVYHFVDRDNSTIIEYDNFTVEEVDEVSYYVHYQLVYIDVTDNETVGRWMISEEDMESTNYMAYCEEEELRDCGTGSWYVQTLFQSASDSSSSSSESGEISQKIGDGYIMNVIDEFMTIRDGHCDSAFVNEDSKELGDESKTTLIVLIVLCVVMLLMLICFAPTLIRKWTDCRSTNGMKGKQAVGDMEEDVDHDEAENVEMSLEVEVEINHTNFNGEPVTATRD